MNMNYKILLAILLTALIVIFYYERLILGNECLFVNSLRQHIAEPVPMQFKIETFWHEDKYVLKLCPEKPPGLMYGTIPVDLRTPKPAEIEQEYPQLEMGGFWRPPNCTARHKLAVIVPYRSRERHLLGFLHHIHGFLQCQQLEYALFVVEQADELTFNRGKLLNIGFVEALRFYDWQCFVFHDIDSLPENYLNLYSCPENSSIVKHMVYGFKKSGYKPYYNGYFSGAIIFTEDGYRRINGYSNDYWGWGGEDDDLLTRVNSIAGMKIWRSSQEIGRYQQFPHNRDKENPTNPCRFKMLKRTEQKKSTDGLSNLKYRLKSISYSRLYTLIQVNLLRVQFNDWKNYTKTVMGCK